MPEDEQNFTTSLTRFSLNRKVTVFVLLLTMIVIGIIASVGIPLETFPRGIEFPMLRVTVPWRGAPAESVMEKITLPLEEELATVPNLDRLSSRTSSSYASVSVRMKQGSDMDVAYREVRDRVERARQIFPDDVERTYVFKQDLSGMPVMAVGIVVDTELGDVYELVQKEIILPISRIDGVANVNADGLRRKEVMIEVDKAAIRAHGLNIFDLSKELGGDNFTMASGTVRDAGKKFLLRSVASYKSVEELRDRKISATATLKDVATITYEAPLRKYAVRVNRKPAFGLVVMKESEANTVEISRKVRKQLEMMKDNPRLASVEMQPFFDQGEIIEDSLSNLIRNGRVGGLLAGLVLFVFIRQFRLTAIISLSIPLCLLLALGVMYFMGETLNILTILGLVICVGLLVDNSVVVAENILRLRSSGMTRRDACIRGASEISLAITLATLTTVAVFLPMSLVEGEGKFFMQRLCIPIVVSLFASLLIALVFIPLSVYITFPNSRAAKQRSRICHGFMARVARIYALTFDKLRVVYNFFLKHSLRRRLDLIFVLGIVYYFTTTVAYKNVGLAETQEEDKMQFNIGISMPEFEFEETSAYFEEVEEIMEGQKDELGLTGFLVQYGQRGGRVEAWLDKDARHLMGAKEVGTRVYKSLPKQAGVRLYYSEANEEKDQHKNDVFMVRLEGDDSLKLQEVADQLEELFAQVDGVIGVRQNNQDAPSEMGLVVDRERAQASQVDPGTIAGVVGTALRGKSLPRYNDNGRQVPVSIQFQESDRETLKELSAFYVPTRTGSFLPISAVTSTEMLKTPRRITRRDRRVSHSIVLELEKDQAKEARETLMAFQALIDLPEGVRFGAMNTSFNHGDIDSMKFAGIMSIVFIYLLMGFLFESFILPLSIVLTIPLAGIGVAWIHYIMDKDLDMLGIVGIILLIGVVVNNGIVLIDYVNQLRKEGMSRSEALLKGSDRRFRPIVMTAMTTIIGMLPLTVSKPSAIGLSYKSFGLTLIGGMTTATLLTLLVVPVFYTFFDDARIAVGRAAKRAFVKREKKAPEMESASA
ncbi:MAG: acriflavin resistance protein [Verrucomicrobiales bacterium]|nr:acriflavin resistance protein [Verrucomicrobiales bacterium]